MNSIRCRQCEHYVEANAGEGKIYGCDRSKCVFEQTTKIDCDNADCNNCINHKYCDYEPTTKNNLAVSSELEKNSKKLEKGTTKNDLGVDAVSRQTINGYIDYILSHGMGKRKSFEFIKKFVTNLPSVTPQEPTEKCTWTKYDYRTMYPKEHDADNPYWRIPENRMEALKYCPYCGKEIEVEK